MNRLQMNRMKLAPFGGLDDMDRHFTNKLARAKDGADNAENASESIAWETRRAETRVLCNAIEEELQ